MLLNHKLEFESKILKQQINEDLDAKDTDSESRQAEIDRNRFYICAHECMPARMSVCACACVCARV